MGHVSAQASKALIKLIKDHKILKEQQNPALFPREALSTGNAF